jgi:hypothetical protein
MTAIDVSLVLTFHDEGADAARTMACVRRSIVRLAERALRAEVICVLDMPDQATRACVLPIAEWQGWTAIETAFGDPGLARNAGIAESAGRFIAIQDGDDYMSRDWLVRAYLAGIVAARPVVLHPEYVLAFGASNQFFQHLATSEPAFQADGLLMFNPWKVQVVAPREVFIEVAYLPRRHGGARFVFEDWHWHCETLGRGIGHQIVPGTAILYRASDSGMNTRDLKMRGTFGPTSLFSTDGSLGRGRVEALQ